MGLLEKTNPKATRRSVLLNALQGAITVPLVIACVGKPNVRKHWRITMPLFTLLGAAIGGLVEWQVDDDFEELLDGSNQRQAED